MADTGATRRKRGKKKKLLRSTRSNAQAKYERYRKEGRREKNKQRRLAKVQRKLEKRKL